MATTVQEEHTLGTLPTPRCKGMLEHPCASSERLRLCAISRGSDNAHSEPSDPLAKHLLYGLAYTVGSALESTPPSQQQCLDAFIMPNKVGLMAGARAWSKHFHRSQGDVEGSDEGIKGKSDGWWGMPSGPVGVINEKALSLFWRVMKEATWRNLHCLPHGVLVYEVRVEEGYGIRWSQDQSAVKDGSLEEPSWLFRGFVEPMMENGHEVGWKH